VVLAEIKGEATAANVRRINRTEKMIITTSIKRITIIITVIGGTIIEGVVLFSVVENRVKTEIMATITEALMIFIDAGIYFLLKTYACQYYFSVILDYVTNILF